MTPKSLRAEDPAFAGGDDDTEPLGQSGARDRLAGSARFFHPPDSFAALKAQVFPALLRGRQAADVLRIWVLGCSTGEEVYSLAIALGEKLAAERLSLQLIIYGTDLDAAAIEHARRGCYPRSIEHDVSAERLRRAFSEFEGGFRINPALRSRCTFACHNPLADPPLAQMDLVDCRSVLALLEPALQEHLLRLLEYSLKPGGFLFLGPSDSGRRQREQLELVDPRHGLYRKRPLRSDMRPEPEPAKQRAPEPCDPGLEAGDGPHAPGPPPPRCDPAELVHEVERVLLDRYAPPGVLINAAGDILQVHGEIAPFLRPGPGHHSLSLFELLRPELRDELRAALARVQHAGSEPAPTRIRLGEQAAWLRVLPVHGTAALALRYWILFEPSPQPAPGPDAPAAGTTAAEAARLSEELSAARSYLQSVLEQQEASSEELQGISEEVRSAQDELRILQDALAETQKELEQSQGQLSALGGELRQRDRDLLRLRDDLGNLLSEVPLPIVLLDRELHVRRFTPLAAPLLALGPSDLGRSLRELATRPDRLAALHALADLAEEVMRSARPAERDLVACDGRRCRARASPYRTQDHRIDGTILSFVLP
jgi:two-component system CheB/CheR fusion protein